MPKEDAALLGCVLSPLALVLLLLDLELNVAGPVPLPRVSAAGCVTLLSKVKGVVELKLSTRPRRNSR